MNDKPFKEVKLSNKFKDYLPDMNKKIEKMVSEGKTLEEINKYVSNDLQTRFPEGYYQLES